MRNGIHLQPRGTVLVFRGNRAPADAARRRGLPVPGLFAQGGGSGDCSEPAIATPLRILRSSRNHQTLQENLDPRLRFDYLPARQNFCPSIH